MASPDERAGSNDRDAARKLVEDALKAGRIIQADRDMRVGDLERAQTLQDIDLVVRDLRVQAPAPGAVVSAAPGTQQPWPLVNYGPQSHETATVARATAKAGRGITGIIGVIVLASFVIPIVGAIIAFANARDSFDFDALGPTDDTTYAPGQTPGEHGINVHTVDGYADLVEGLRGVTGATTTYSAVLYPRYAVLQVPLKSRAGRYQTYYWDGTLNAQDSKGKTTDEPIDLTTVDPQQLIGMLQLVRGRIQAPDSWYVVISDPPGVPAQISAYASNEFNETTYVVQSFDGTIIYDSGIPQ